MSDLERKLEEIIFDNVDIDGRYDKEEFISSIRQAFIDDGWTKEPRQYDKYGSLKINGREWYDKFEKELNTYAWSFDEKNSILVTAKKAAGIEE